MLEAAQCPLIRHGLRRATFPLGGRLGEVAERNEKKG